MIKGRGGDDQLSGDAGNHRLIGGDGDDRYNLSFYQAGPTIREDAGGGIDTVVLLYYRTFTLADQFENLRCDVPSVPNFVGTGNGKANKIVGSNYADTLYGRAGEDLVRGREGEDRLLGGRDNDYLIGARHADVLIGGHGFDRMAGGIGGDRFVWREDETGVGASADALLDFLSGKDTIDLRNVDADRTQGSDQAFVWIGSAGFSGTAGEARFAGGRLSMDTDGDGEADLQVRLAGGASLAEADVLL